MIVEVLAEPSGTRIGSAPAGVLTGGGEAPYISEDVCDPALALVEGLGGLVPRGAQPLDS